MGHILQVQVIDNGRGGHDDLIFKIDGLLEKREFDTYYFALEVGSYENLPDTKNAVASLFTYWLNETQKLNVGQVIFLPIDFSDQYTGCLRVKKQEDRLLLSYGHSSLEGYSVNPLDPGDYCNTIDDFNDTENKTTSISEIDFINSIKHTIETLKNGS